MQAIIDELLKRLKAALGGTFATYEAGRRDLVGRSDLPLLCVYPRVTRSRRGGTGNDDAEFDVGVMAVLSVSAGSPNQPRSAQARTQEDIIRAFEGRDADGKPLANSVLGVLNADLTVGGKALYTDGAVIAYDSEFDGKAMTERVSLTFTAHARPPR